MTLQITMLCEVASVIVMVLYWMIHNFKKFVESLHYYSYALPSLSLSLSLSLTLTYQCNAEC